MVRGLEFRIWDYTIYVAKTKTLISCSVTAQLICAFVFAYAKTGFVMTQLSMSWMFKIQDKHMTTEILNAISFDATHRFLNSHNTYTAIYPAGIFVELVLIQD